MATAYALRETTQELYRLFSHEPYNPKESWVLPNEFVLDPLFQQKKQEYVNDVILEEKPFILAGPEFNTINVK
jgi:hypothetical protein